MRENKEIIKVSDVTTSCVIMADRILQEENIIDMSLSESKSIEELGELEENMKEEIVSNEPENEKGLDEQVEMSTCAIIQEVTVAYEEERLEEVKKVKEHLKQQKEAQQKAKKIAENLQKDKSVFTYSVYKPSKLSVKQLNNILKETGLEGQGQAYYDMEKKYGVNALFAISVAFQESGYGYHRINTNNCYGMRNGSKGWMSFNSLRDNIMYFGKLMQKSWYKGKDIDGISKVYCPPTHEDWANSIKAMMKKIYKNR